jgi:hypothetical protein
MFSFGEANGPDVFCFQLRVFDDSSMSRYVILCYSVSAKKLGKIKNTIFEADISVKKITEKHTNCGSTIEREGGK